VKKRQAGSAGTSDAHRDDEAALPASPASPTGIGRAATEPRELASFLGSLAHDLRSPLGVIAQALAELRDGLSTHLTEEQRLLATLADRGVLRLGRIADAVSLTAVVEDGTLTLRPAPVDLITLLRDAAGAAFAIETRREVDLICDLDEGPCVIVADADRLKRALVELGINAIRYARRTARIRLDLGPHRVRVFVEDDGQGVPVERRATLFDRFTPRASRAGLGVGLSNAREVIAAHRGELSLEASTLPPGRPGTIGACFVVSLPIEGSR